MKLSNNDEGDSLVRLTQKRLPASKMFVGACIAEFYN
jgi:hypothetical protein